MTGPRIHPTAFIAPGACVMGDVTLGEDSSVWYTSVVRGDTAPITIGAQTCLQDATIVHVDEGVPCTIGPRVGVGHRVILHGCTVEEDSLVAAGALLPEGMVVPPGSLVMGMPARVVRPVTAELTRRIEHTWRHYVEQARAHRAGRFPLVSG